MGMTIIDKKNYRYAGRCRQCGFYCEWLHGPKEFTDYRGFYNSIVENMFPAFLKYCENCSNEAVFDLTAFTSED